MWVIYEIKQDGSKDRWMSLDTEDAARGWAANYNENQRPTRRRNFLIEEEVA